MPNGAVEIKGRNSEPFIVNGQRLKHYYCIDNVDYLTCLKLIELPAHSHN